MNASPDLTRIPEGVDPGTARALAYQQRLREEERRKRMLADAQHLLTLSTELKAEIERAPGGSVSAEVTRKAAEAEKLARELGTLNKGQL